LEKESSN